MNKLLKFLQKLDRSQCNVVEELIDQILQNTSADLDIKKIRGYKNVFRIRKGRIRIIYSIDENKKVTIVFVGLRDDDTYKNL